MIVEVEFETKISLPPMDEETLREFLSNLASHLEEVAQERAAALTASNPSPANDSKPLRPIL